MRSQRVGLRVDLRSPGVGQTDFEPAEERQGKDHQQEEQQHVEHGIGGEGIEGVGTEQCRNQKSQGEVDDHDARAINKSIAQSTAFVLATLQEERDGHGDDGPDARHEDCQQSTDEAHQQDIEQGAVGQVVCPTLAAQLVNDGCPKAVGSGCHCAVG